MLAVIRIRGRVGIKKEIRDTFKMLNLDKKYRCVVIPETPQYVGMVKKIKDYSTWGPISEEVLIKLIEKRGRTIHNEKISETFLKKKKLKDMKNLAKKIMEGTKLKELGLKPYFRLSPPSKGFKGSVKQPYPKGALGNRGEKINDLLKKMI